MPMRPRPVLPIVAALWLQIAPLVARLEPAAVAFAQPVVMLWRWMVGGAAVSGAFHAVSGATGLTVTGAGGVIPSQNPIPGSNNVALTVRFVIQSEEYGIPKVYTYENLPPGINRVSIKTDTVQGKPTRSGRFTSRVTGWELANATGFSAIFEVVWIIQGTLPVVTLQPVSQSVAPGADVTFGVTATGEAPLTYRWFRDDLEIAATDANLTLTNVDFSDAGPYRVRVMSPAGSTFSETATLTVVAPSVPIITGQPLPQTVTEGDPVSFTVTAAGIEKLKYAWLKNDTEIGGNTTNVTLTIPAVAPEDAGEYRVRVTDANASVLSEPASLVVSPQFPPPKILSQSGDHLLYPGDNLRLFVTVATGNSGSSAEITWSRAGVTLGARGWELELSPVSPSTAGTYLAAVNTAGGQVWSAPITVAVEELPVLEAGAELTILRFSFNSIPSREYQLESNGIRDRETWAVQQTLRALARRTEIIESVVPGARFFRLRVIPLP